MVCPSGRTVLTQTVLFVHLSEDPLDFFAGRTTQLFSPEEGENNTAYPVCNPKESNASQSASDLQIRGSGGRLAVRDSVCDRKRWQGEQAVTLALTTFTTAARRSTVWGFVNKMVVSVHNQWVLFLALRD